MPGSIGALAIAPAPQMPMIALTTARLVPGRGIEGDRFYTLRGTDARIDAETCDVTLVEQEALVQLRRAQPELEPDTSGRRTIVVAGYVLRDLIGQTFRIGEVVLRGLAPHEACSSEAPQQATSCTLLAPADLRAQVLTPGSITIGDQLELVE